MPKKNCILHLNLAPYSDNIQFVKENNKKTGGDIKIHGYDRIWTGKFHRFYDCSIGCICVTNTEIKELFDYVQFGTPIEILP
ncbi:MAG TPA: L,D-transpeptidase [Chitinophagales bacterium]|nr:L,D-transpeptidase [Chitinophagales bacterium]